MFDHLLKIPWFFNILCCHFNINVYKFQQLKKKKVTPAFIEYEAKLHPLPQEVLELVMIVQSNSLSVVTCILSHFIMHT